MSRSSRISAAFKRTSRRCVGFVEDHKGNAAEAASTARLEDEIVSKYVWESCLEGGMIYPGESLSKVPKRYE